MVTHTVLFLCPFCNWSSSCILGPKRFAHWKLCCVINAEESFQEFEDMSVCTWAIWIIIDDHLWSCVGDVWACGIYMCVHPCVCTSVNEMCTVWICYVFVCAKWKVMYGRSRIIYGCFIEEHLYPDSYVSYIMLYHTGNGRQASHVKLILHV